MSSLVGRTLGQYEVVELIGQGGMATVYKGYQGAVGRNVAIKVLPPHPGLNESFIERFRLEARTIGKLQHPHILPLYDYGTEDDILYLVMAFVEGGTLEDLIDHGAMSLDTIDKLLRDIASAMDYAHRHGVIHRDIKPGNILIDSEGHALLADFGIVKMTEGGANLTGTGVVGTPAYMAPEQGQGIEVDARADIYSLGVVVYEMITGQQPYTANTPMQIVLKHISDPVPDIQDVIPDLPANVAAVMQRVLAKNADDRYQSAVEFAQDFTHAVQGTEIFHAIEAERPLVPRVAPVETEVLSAAGKAEQHPPAETQTVIVHQGNNPLILLAAFGFIALVIVVVAVLLVNQQGDDEPATPTAVVDAAATGTAIAVAAAPSPPPTTRPEPTFGNVTFGERNVPGDTVQIQVTNLSPPGNGQVYAAWLLNIDDGSTLALGELTLDAFGSGFLIYTDANETTLPTMYNAIIITPEESPGSEPQGEVIYSGAVPVETTQFLRELLEASESGIEGSGLLDSALTEAGFAAQHSGLAASANSAGSMQTHAEHTINILNGEQEDYNDNGRGENPGRGFGIFVFIDQIEERLRALANSPRASVNFQGETELISVCLQNVREWADRVVELELELIAAETIEEVAEEAAEAKALAASIEEGVDANENGLVEPFELECGLQQITTFGVLIGSMNIAEGSAAVDSG